MPLAPKSSASIERKRQQKLYDAQRAEDHKFYSSQDWKACRKAFLMEHPFCSECRAKGKIVAAVDVHHVAGRRTANPFDWALLAGLCHSCHSKGHGKSSFRGVKAEQAAKSQSGEEDRS